STLRILWTDVVARLALLVLVGDLVLAARRPVVETVITVGACLLVAVFRWVRWIDFFSRALEVDGTIGERSYSAHVHIGHGMAGSYRAPVRYSYTIDGDFFTGSFSDHASRWPVGQAASTIALLVDRARPERSEPRARWKV